MQETNALLQAAINLLAALIPLILPPLIAILIAWVRGRFAAIEAALPESVSKALANAVYMAVTFAEQVGAERMLKEYGMTKKDAAIQVAQEYLQSIGYEIDLATLDAAIEAAVFTHIPRG